MANLLVLFGNILPAYSPETIAISGAILFLLALLLAYIYSDLVKIRLHGWIDPWFRSDSNFYQISQAWIAKHGLL